MAKDQSSPIDQILSKHSISAVRNWLRNRGLTHSAGSKAELRARVEGLIEKGSVSVEDVAEGAIGIEEASSKRTFLFSIPHTPKDLGRIDAQLKALKVPVSETRLPSTNPKAKSTLVYAMNTGLEFRAKWNELHTRIEVNRKARKVSDVPDPKVIVCIVSKESGLVELRCDPPGDDHSHTQEGAPTDAAYYTYYKEQVENLLGLPLEPLNLHSGLEKVIRKIPRVVRVGHTLDETSEGGVTKRTHKHRNKDVRDLHDFPKNENGSTSVLRTFEEAPLYWLPEMSEGQLKREVYSYVNAADGMVRFHADCYEGEIAYVLSQLV